MLIVMDTFQTLEVCHLAPKSKVVAIHMEALDHATVSRVELGNFVRAHEVNEDQLIIPADGEVVLL